MTLHGKAGKKVNARARVWWHGTLSVSPISQICAYVISKTKSVTVDIVLHAKAFVQSSELFDTLMCEKTRVWKDTRASRQASQNSHLSDSNLSTWRNLLFLVRVEKYMVDNICFSFVYYYKMNTHKFTSLTSRRAYKVLTIDEVDSSPRVTVLHVNLFHLLDCNFEL